MDISEPAMRIQDISADEFMATETFEPIKSNTKRTGRVPHSSSEKTKVTDTNLRIQNSPRRR